MSKSFRKIMCIVLALVLCLSLSGCSVVKDKIKIQDKTAESATESLADSTAEAAESGADAADSTAELSAEESAESKTDGKAQADSKIDLGDASEVAEESTDESAEESTDESVSEKTIPEVKDFHPYCTEETDPDNFIVEYHIYVNDEEVESYEPEQVITMNDCNYAQEDGIFTFRGNNFRNAPTVGNVTMYREGFDIEHAWTHETTYINTPDGSTWTGNGWTGQPLMRRWTKEEKEIMNMYDWAKEKDDLVEVIYASLDGWIYFMDLDTGEDTRDPLFIGRVFKGAGSLDPRGLPILYVGSGYESRDDGSSMIHIISLIDGSVLYTIGWNDPYRTRPFSYFDSSALVCAETDQLIYPGENGVLYIMTLNTEFDAEAGTVSVNPDPVVKLVYYNTRGLLGMEDSCVIFQHYLYVADNGGDMICFDLSNMQMVWVQDVLDDTNDSPVLEITEDGEVFLYISPAFRAWYRYDEDEVGDIPIFKINALNGEIEWATSFDCLTIEDLAGGVEATVALGEGSLEGLVYCAVARTPSMYTGQLVALDRETGEIVWSYESAYSWSSPVCVYAQDGYGYVVNANFDGDLNLLDGKTGELLDSVNLGFNIEASPAVYENRLVVGTRGMLIWGIEFN